MLSLILQQDETLQGSWRDLSKENQDNSLNPIEQVFQREIKSCVWPGNNWPFLIVEVVIIIIVILHTICFSCLLFFGIFSFSHGRVMVKLMILTVELVDT